MNHVCTTKEPMRDSSALEPNTFTYSACTFVHSENKADNGTRFVILFVLVAAFWKCSVLVAFTWWCLKPWSDTIACPPDAHFWSQSFSALIYEEFVNRLMSKFSCVQDQSGRPFSTCDSADPPALYSWISVCVCFTVYLHLSVFFHSPFWTGCSCLCKWYWAVHVYKLCFSLQRLFFKDSCGRVTRVRVLGYCIILFSSLSLLSFELAAPHPIVPAAWPPLGSGWEVRPCRGETWE